MKNVHLVGMFCFLAIFGHSQTNQILGHNNARATLNTSGSFFHNDTSGLGGYEVPANSGRNAVYYATFLYGAKDAQGQKYTCFGGSPGQTDVFCGPYSHNQNYDSTYHSMYDGKIWTICQEEIDAYHDWWLWSVGLSNPNPTPPVPSNAVMDKIFFWPAYGNVSNGEDFYLAPYYDYDSDGNYDPTNGDYPLIKGCCASYMVQNDAAAPHTNSYTDPIGLQMQYMFYQYKNWGTLNNVTFVDVLATNESNVDYPEFVYGVFMDVDLGSYSDDYIGADSALSMLYFYNGDDFDEINGNNLGYGVNPPAFGVVALETPAHSVLPYNTTNVTFVNWNTMNGLTVNGQPIIHPDGYPTNYLLSDNPNIANGWSEEELGSPNGDRRGMLSVIHGPLASGESIAQTYAFIYNRDGNRLQNVDGLYANAQEVIDFYAVIDSAQCEDGQLGLEESPEITVGLYPNPSQGVFTVSNDLNAAMTIRVLDLTGKEVLREESNTSEVELDLRDASKGMYVVWVNTALGSHAERLVIQK